MERRLFALQRLTALVMAPLVLVHLGVIVYAVRGGLTAAQILDRTQGNWLWIVFYGTFVACATIHVPIGLRNILIEWARLPRAAASAVSGVFGVVLLVLGWRAVAAIGGLLA